MYALMVHKTSFTQSSLSNAIKVKLWLEKALDDFRIYCMVLRYMFKWIMNLIDFN